MARRRPSCFKLCEAMIGCDGSQYIQIIGDAHCGKCKAALARRTKQNIVLRGAHYMDYALKTKRESEN